MTHADPEDMQGPANLSWLVGRQLDRIGMAVYDDHKTIGPDVMLLEAMGAYYLDRNKDFEDKWEEIHKGLKKGDKIPQTVRIEELRLICKTLVKEGVLLRHVQYWEEDFEQAKLEALSESGGGDAD